MNTTLKYLAIFTALISPAFAKGPEPMTDLQQTITAAAEQKKMAFVLLGRATCGNCNATKEMIQSGTIPVSNAHYVMGDLNVDDAKVNAAFMKQFPGQNFGNTLPFVVITDGTGKTLASSGGYKTPQEWTAILREAKKKAAPTASAAPAGGAGGNWPFKSAPAGQ